MTTIPEKEQHNHQYTPLMLAVNNWNVRMIEYLIERNADPTLKDKFGFTSKEKAKIKNLNTISNILEDYEDKFDSEKATEKYKEILEEESKVLEYE